MSRQSFHPPKPIQFTWSASYPHERASATSDACKHSSMRNFTSVRRCRGVLGHLEKVANLVRHFQRLPPGHDRARDKTRTGDILHTRGPAPTGVGLGPDRSEPELLRVQGRIAGEDLGLGRTASQHLGDQPYGNTRPTEHRLSAHDLWVLV